MKSTALLQQAVALQRSGKLEEAAALCGRASALAPGDPALALAYALALAGLGRHAEAEPRLRRLTVQLPKAAMIWDHWCVVLLRCGKVAEAIRAGRQAVALDPKLASAWHHLGIVLLNCGQATEALAAQERALRLDPREPGARHGRAMALQHLHRIPEAVEEYGRAVAAQPENFEARSHRLFALHYLDGISREELWAEHRAYAAALPTARARDAFRAATASSSGTPAAEAASGWDLLATPADRVDCPDRLRVGFLSPDLREHSVAYFLEPLVRELGAQGCDVYLYHDHYQVDAVSARLRAASVGWRHLVGLPNAAAAQAIRSDALDVLVELAGHTGLNRLPLLATRLAPLQVSYLGYPDTTGVPAIDCRLVDAITDPVGDADRFASERLVRFSSTAWTYAAPAEAPSPKARADGPPVFGSCNNAAKLSDATLRGWARLLAATPDARLLLKAAGLGEAHVAKDFHRRMDAAGLPLERVELVERTATLADHLAFYHRIDVALDPFPYHGTTTTCEALWMGVPVVSLQGDRHCARVGGSLLAAIGHPDWAVTTWDEYVHQAQALATTRPDRAALRAQMAASLLCDPATQAARFASALRQCYRDRMAGHWLAPGEVESRVASGSSAADRLARRDAASSLALAGRGGSQ